MHICSIHAVLAHTIRSSTFISNKAFKSYCLRKTMIMFHRLISGMLFLSIFSATDLHFQLISLWHHFYHSFILFIEHDEATEAFIFRGIFYYTFFRWRIITRTNVWPNVWINVLILLLHLYWDLDSRCPESVGRERTWFAFQTISISHPSPSWWW